MSSSSIPNQLQDSLDDHSFHTHSERGPGDPTGVPNFPPEEGRGNHFTPFNIEYRDFQVKSLPKEPLELFQIFIPISLVQSWIKYTNDWVTYLIENAIDDNWKSPRSKHSRIHQWDGRTSGLHK
jgi:hypothetical protein